MLSKFSKIKKKGTGEYIRPQSDKLSYGNMVFVRALIVCFAIAWAATIAIRYSAVRRYL